MLTVLYDYEKPSKHINLYWNTVLEKNRRAELLWRTKEQRQELMKLEAFDNVNNKARIWINRMPEGFKRKVQFILVVQKISINVYVKEVQIVTSKTTKINMQLGPSFSTADYHQPRVKIWIRVSFFLVQTHFLA